LRQLQSGVEWEGFLKKANVGHFGKNRIKDFNPKRWLRKLFEKPIGLAMCENWNSSKELRVRKMIFSLSF